MPEKRKVFVVDRSKWFRGKGNEASCPSYLRKRNGKMCCIGFVGQQSEVSNKAMKDKTTIHSLSLDDIGKFPEWMRRHTDVLAPFSNDSDIGKCYRINDETDITDRQREAKLRKIFKKHKMTIKFVG